MFRDQTLALTLALAPTLTLALALTLTLTLALTLTLTLGLTLAPTLGAHGGARGNATRGSGDVANDNRQGNNHLRLA